MVYAHGDADIVVDTTSASANECAVAIVDKLDAVAFPKAFDRLRDR
jgi:chloramphenicol 3-O phosphotransferase